MPNPTRTPARRSAVTRATPAASFAFDPGQCATAAPRDASSATSESDSCTPCAASTRPPSRPTASSSAGTDPYSARCTRSSSAASATWMCTSAPRALACSPIDASASGGSVYAACGP